MPRRRRSYRRRILRKLSRHGETVAYVALLAVGLTTFVWGLRACSPPPDVLPDGRVQIVDATR